jgi:predicted Na+-dependent transporter
MLSSLAKLWFVLLLAGGVALAWARPGWVRPWAGRPPLPALVALSLFLVAWGMEGRSLYRAAVRPWAALWAVAVSYGALPALAWLAGPLLPLPDLAVGLLIIASVPCTLASAVLWTRLGGGNEAVALLVVVLTTNLSWLATTLWLALTTGARVSAGPETMMRGLALVLLLPVGLGQLARAVPGVAAFVARHRALNGNLSRLLLLTILLRAAADLSGRTSGLTAPALLATAAVALGLHLSALSLALGGARALRLPRPDGIAAAFAGSQKTLPVALFLFATYYEARYPLAVVAVVFYHVGQLLADTLIAEWLAGRAAAGKRS